MAFNIGITVTAKNTSGRALGKVNSDLDKTRKKARSTTKALKGLRLAFGLIAVGVLVNFGKQLVQTTGKLQLMLIRLANVEGGAKNARITFDKLFKTFGASPFTIDSVTDSFVRLRAAGIESKLAFDAVSAGADAIAAFGGTSEELKRFSIGLQQVAGKGVLSMEELRQQIGEALPVAMRVFASETGRSISEVIAEVEKGKISSQEFIVGLTTGLQKSFGGFAAKLGDTVLGSIQGAISTIKKAIADIFLGTTDVAVRMAAIFQNAGKAAAEFIRGITQEDVVDFFNTLKGGVDIIIGVGKALIELGKIVVKVFNFIQNIANLESAATIGAFGVIGFMLFGPVGGLAGIVAGLATVGGGVDNLVGKINTPADPGADNLFNRLLNFDITEPGGPQEQFERAKKAFADFRTSVKAQAASATGGATLAESLFGDQEQFDRIKKNLEDVANPTKDLAPLIQGLGKTSGAALKQLEGLEQRTTAALAGAQTFPFVKTAETSLNRLSKIMEGFEGDRKLRDALAATSIRTADQQSQFEALGRELTKVDTLAAKVNKTIARTRAVGFVDALVKANDAAGEVLSKFTKLKGGISEADERANSIREKFRDIEVDLRKQLKTQEALSKAGGFQTEATRKLRDALSQVANERKKSLDASRVQAQIDSQILALNTKLAKLADSQQIAQLQREGRGGFEQVLGSGFTDEAADRRAELNRSIADTKVRILELQLKINEAVGNPDLQEALAAQQESARKLVTAQQEALASTTAAGLAAREMWASVNDTLTSVVEEGIKGVINGTKSFKDIQLDAMNAITDAAVKYLIELIKIKFQTIAINALGGTGGGGGGGGFDIGGIFSSLIGGFFAKGGAFKGNVKPFANGDIVRGPTMFGLAGEAGDEAIMPLTRVGGKLGVATNGAGGDSFAITISAIDTESGVEFIRKNADSIVNTMRAANNLNRGEGRVR